MMEDGEVQGFDIFGFGVWGSVERVNNSDFDKREMNLFGQDETLHLK